jgi:class 3 adenylate cyclase
MLDSIPLLACRSVICSGYVLLVGYFGNLTRELAEESGDGDEKLRLGRFRRSFVQAIEKRLRHLGTIHTGKEEMHEALRGDEADMRLLRELGNAVRELKTKVIAPLKRLFSRSQNEDGRTIRDKTAIQNRKRAEQRLSEALVISHEGRTEQFSIICLDMVGYTNHARSREIQSGPHAVLELNRAIRDRLADTIRQALVEAGEIEHLVPVQYLGDGAIVYLNAGPEKAVQIARSFQLDSMLRNRRAKGTKDKPWEFRIGVATGKVCLAMQHNPDGRLVEFSAGGEAIINAARLEKACKANGVRIDEATHTPLPDQPKRIFRRVTNKKGRRTDGTKKHEQRTIPSWEWHQVRTKNMPRGRRSAPARE